MVTNLNLGLRYIIHLNDKGLDKGTHPFKASTRKSTGSFSKNIQKLTPNQQVVVPKLVTVCVWGLVGCLVVWLVAVYLLLRNGTRTILFSSGNNTKCSGCSDSLGSWVIAPKDPSGTTDLVWAVGNAAYHGIMVYWAPGGSRPHPHLLFLSASFEAKKVGCFAGSPCSLRGTSDSSL